MKVSLSIHLETVLLKTQIARTKSYVFSKKELWIILSHMDSSYHIFSYLLCLGVYFSVIPPSLLSSELYFRTV